MKKTFQTVSLFLMFFLVLGVAVDVASARDGKKKKKPRGDAMVEGWIEEIRDIDQLIQAGENQKALKTGNRLASDVVDRVVSGDQAARILGSINALRAVSAYNLGNRNLANWHWQISIQMFPELMHEMDLSRFGEAEKFLKEQTAQYEASHRRADELLKGLEENKSSEEFDGVPPKNTRRVMPQFPRAKREAAMVDGLSVSVRTVITEDGALKHPRILQADGEFTLVCATLEAMRKWEFRPASHEGKPVESFFVLNFNF